MKRTILIDARMYGLENTGIGRYLINLIKELKNLKADERYILLLKKKYYLSLDLPENWKKVLADFGNYSFTEQLLLPKILKKENPNLVHFPHFNIPLFWKGQFLVTIHDTTMHKQGKNASKLPLLLYLFKRIPYFLLFKKAILESKAIIVPSKAVKDDIVKGYNIDAEKVNVIYEGVDSAIDSDKSVKEKKQILRKYGLLNAKYFVYTGNCYPHKNIDRLIEAISYLVNKKNMEVKLLIVTKKGFFRNKLEKIILENNIMTNVVLADFISDDELAILYSQSTAFVYPSLSEGFGLQGLEAMSTQTLVLASDIAVFKEVYKNNAIYFNPFDFSSIATIMSEALYMSSEKRQERIDKAKEYTKKYSWQKMATETFEIYNSIKL